MSVRALDANHDWTFGSGKNNYLSGIPAIIQTIDCRLLEFLGDCCFNLGAGIDWWNFLGSKDEIPLRLAISAVILNTPQVTGLLQLSTSLSPKRVFSAAYKVQTSLSPASSVFQYDLNAIG